MWPGHKQAGIVSHSLPVPSALPTLVLQAGDQPGFSKVVSWFPGLPRLQMEPAGRGIVRRAGP